MALVSSFPFTKGWKAIAGTQVRDGEDMSLVSERWTLNEGQAGWMWGARVRGKGDLKMMPAFWFSRD